MLLITRVFDKSSMFLIERGSRNTIGDLSLMKHFSPLLLLIADWREALDHLMPNSTKRQA